MSASLLIIMGLVIIAGGAVLALPGKSFSEAMRISLNQAMRVIPIILPAAFIAGFLAELLPNDFVAGLFGRQGGWIGYAIAAAAGCLLPTGPMVVLPLGAALMQAGAGLAPVLTLYSAWTLMNVQRLFIWELPLVGKSLATRRYLGGVVVTPIAIASSILVAALLER